jgi:hypothetical protein
MVSLLGRDGTLRLKFVSERIVFLVALEFGFGRNQASMHLV